MLTVSIVTHNTPMAQLRKAVECIMRSPRVTGIHIVDNSPTHPDLSVLGSQFPTLKAHYVENRGFGAGHNVAIREALKGNPDGYHLVMNADVWWEGDVLTPILEFLDVNPDVGLLGSRTVYPDGTLQHTVRELPTPFISLARRFVPGFLTRKRMRRYLMADTDHSKPIEAKYLIGCFLMFRNSALADCGLFDERFFMYPEDIDITRRISERHRALYWPGVTIVHEHQRASRKSLKMLSIHCVNMIRYFNKWGWR